MFMLYFLIVYMLSFGLGLGFGVGVFIIIDGGGVGIIVLWENFGFWIEGLGVDILFLGDWVVGGDGIGVDIGVCILDIYKMRK